MKNRLKIGLILTALMLCITLFIVGCDGGKNGEDSTQATESTAADVTETSAEDTSDETGEDTSTAPSEETETQVNEETSEETTEETTAETTEETTADTTHVCSDSKTDNDHKCDSCGKTVEECVDVDPKDHECDICGGTVGEHTLTKDHVCEYCGEDNASVPDFTVGPIKSPWGGRADYASGVEGNGHLRLNGEKESGGAFVGAALENYPIIGYQYEITYDLEISDKNMRVAMLFAIANMQHSSKPGTTSRGEVGWSTVKNANNKSTWQIGGNPQDGSGTRFGTALTWSVTPDVGENNARSFKVRVDGINDTMSLYVISGGEYKLVETMPVASWDNAYNYLNIALFVFDKIPAGAYVEVSDLTVFTLCSDLDKDHACDLCKSSVSECSDATDDADHKCDYCGKVVEECFEAGVKDHKCDACGAEIGGKCADTSPADHNCDYCGKKLSDCKNENSDSLCDICGIDIAHTEADANKDHKCDVCGKSDSFADHKLADNKHVCNYCGKTIGELVEFGGDRAFASYEAGTEIYERTLGSIKISNKNATGGGNYGATTDYVIPGHIYEITYVLRRSDLSQTRMAMRFIQGEVTSFTADESKDSGYLGWVLAKGSSTTIYQIANNNIQYGSGCYATVERDIGTVNNEQSFKVVVDGITNTMTLYALKGSEYVFVNSMTFAATSPNLIINTGAWDTFKDSNFVELSNVSVAQLCSDVDSDHLCDVCGDKLSNHTDAANDGDHRCDYCGAASVTACANSNNDHVCDGDSVCEKFADHVYVSGSCSACNVAEHAEIDANGDNKCDICESKIDRLYLLADNKNNVKIYGRSFNLVRGIACDFSGSGIEFKLNASGDVIIKVESEGTSYYTLYINGVRQEKRFEFTDGTKEYVLAEDLAKGDYTFKLIKQTQAPHSLSVMISLRANGKLLDRPADKELLIEFIGDSITCGYGLVGYPTEGVTNYGGAKYMDATLAYAYKAAEALGADHSFVSLSGWAVLPSAPGKVDGCVPAIYGQTSYRRSEVAYDPEREADIVVIHLGTNDLYSRKDTYETDFVKAAKDFIADVKAMNPDAKIVWVYGSMMSGSNLTSFEKKVNTIINDLGGASAGFYSVKVPQNSSGTNNSHPNVAAQAESATILADFIKNTVLD